MNENNNEQEQPLYKEQPWWVQIFVALYAMFWLTMIFAACQLTFLHRRINELCNFQACINYSPTLLACQAAQKCFCVIHLTVFPTLFIINVNGLV